MSEESHSATVGAAVNPVVTLPAMVATSSDAPLLNIMSNAICDWCARGRSISANRTPVRRGTLTGVIEPRVELLGPLDSRAPRCDDDEAARSYGRTVGWLY